MLVEAQVHRRLVSGVLKFPTRDKFTALGVGKFEHLLAARWYRLRQFSNRLSNLSRREQGKFARLTFRLFITSTVAGGRVALARGAAAIGPATAEAPMIAAKTASTKRSDISLFP